MASKLLSLRDRQRGALVPDLLTGLQLTVMLASIEKILNLNRENAEVSVTINKPNGDSALPHSTAIVNEDGDPIWKIVVFDNMGRDILSSVLRVNDLRALGVTIHL